MNKLRKLDISSSGLHILAMALMLCDHLWVTVVPGNQWLTCIGRLAFPIFAFMIVEGYYHTRNWRRYALRLLIGAVISEIPFNLMCSGSWVYPFHQNVMWTFLMGLCLVRINDRAKDRALSRRVLVGLISTLAGYVAGFITMADYYGVGVVTVLVFYFFRERNWKNLLAQIIVLLYFNAHVLGGLGYEVSVLGQTVFLPQQGLALFALIPIWLYRGRKGLQSRIFQYVCYGFYPLHMLILWAVRALFIS